MINQESKEMHPKDFTPIALTTEQATIVRQAEADIQAGRGFTMKQVEDQLTMKKAEWRKARHLAAE